jgi:hypothetical protein
MAQIVLGIGTSHGPMLSMPPEMWLEFGADDKDRENLVAPWDGSNISYEELLKHADASIAERLTLDNFREQAATAQKAISLLSETLAEVNPDTVVLVGNDQQEWFFDDLMPSLAVYWGDMIPLRARKLPDSAPAYRKASAWGQGDVDVDVPVNSALAKHIIDSVIEDGFDIAHFRYVRERYGGKIGPAGYYETPTEHSARPQGLPHGPAWVIKRLMDNKPCPIVPIFQNTFYPPNQPTVKRCYAFGKAIRSAIESWDSDTSVAVIASGGFSHFVVDPEIDDLAHKGFRERDPEILFSMPEWKLQMGTSEIKNWVTASAALEHLDYEFVARTPGLRSPAGTGHADAFGIWH